MRVFIHLGCLKTFKVLVVLLVEVFNLLASFQ